MNGDLSAFVVLLLLTGTGLGLSKLKELRGLLAKAATLFGLWALSPHASRFWTQTSSERQQAWQWIQSNAGNVSGGGLGSGGGFSLASLGIGGGNSWMILVGIGLLFWLLSRRSGGSKSKGK